MQKGQRVVQSPPGTIEGWLSVLGQETVALSSGEAGGVDNRDRKDKTGLNGE